MQRWDGLLLLYPLCFVNRMSLAHWALARANLVWPSNSAGHFQSQGPFSEGRFFISVPARSFVSRFTLICLGCLLLQPRSSASPSGWKGDKIPGGSGTALASGQLVTSVSFVLRSSLSAWGRASLLKSVKVDLTRGLLPLWPEGRAELLAGENRVEKHELWVSGPGVRFRCLCAAAKPGLPTARLWVRWSWC